MWEATGDADVLARSSTAVAYNVLKLHFIAPVKTPEAAEQGQVHDTGVHLIRGVNAKINKISGSKRERGEREGERKLLEFVCNCVARRVHPPPPTQFSNKKSNNKNI